MEGTIAERKKKKNYNHKSQTVYKATLTRQNVAVVEKKKKKLKETI